MILCLYLSVYRMSVVLAERPIHLQVVVLSPTILLQHYLKKVTAIPLQPVGLQAISVT